MNIPMLTIEERKSIKLFMAALLMLIIIIASALILAYRNTCRDKLINFKNTLYNLLIGIDENKKKDLSQATAASQKTTEPSTAATGDNIKEEKEEEKEEEEEDKVLKALTGQKQAEYTALEITTTPPNKEDESNNDDSESGDDIPESGDDIPEPGDDIPEPGDDIPEPGDDIPESGDDIPKPGDDDSELGDDIPKPGDNGSRSNDNNYDNAHGITTFPLLTNLSEQPMSDPDTHPQHILGNDDKTPKNSNTAPPDRTLTTAAEPLAPKEEPNRNSVDQSDGTPTKILQISELPKAYLIDKNPPQKKCCLLYEFPADISLCANHLVPTAATAAKKKKKKKKTKLSSRPDRSHFYEIPSTKARIEIPLKKAKIENEDTRDPKCLIDKLQEGANRQIKKNPPTIINPKPEGATASPTTTTREPEGATALSTTTTREPEGATASPLIPNMELEGATAMSAILYTLRNSQKPAHTSSIKDMKNCKTHGKLYTAIDFSSLTKECKYELTTHDPEYSSQNLMEVAT